MRLLRQGWGDGSSTLSIRDQIGCGVTFNLRLAGKQNTSRSHNHSVYPIMPPANFNAEAADATERLLSPTADKKPIIELNASGIADKVGRTADNKLKEQMMPYRCRCKVDAALVPSIGGRWRWSQGPQNGTMLAKVTDEVFTMMLPTCAGAPHQ